MEKCAYKRVMLKVSGEALSGETGFGFDFETVGRIFLVRFKIPIFSLDIYI